MIVLIWNEKEFFCKVLGKVLLFYVELIKIFIRIEVVINVRIFIVVSDDIRDFIFIIFVYFVFRILLFDFFDYEEVLVNGDIIR